LRQSWPRAAGARELARPGVAAGAGAARQALA